MESYRDRRKEIESFFKKSQIVENSKEEFLSPSNKYILSVEYYKTGKNTWEYSRGIVRATENEEIIADIKRNYSNFWHAWCKHQNENEYLLCGEDYQGQTVVNLTARKTTNYFPESGNKGVGFCWVNAYPSPDSKILAVDGCVWACPYEIVLYDFSDPDSLPYKELYRTDNPHEVDGWSENGIFTFSREIEVRKADGEPYDSLSDEEQEEIDDGKVKSEVVKEKINLDINKLL